MDGVLSATEKQDMVASFLEIAVGQTADIATQFLQATSWKLEEALQLYYVGNESGGVTAPSYAFPEENISSRVDQSSCEPKKNEEIETVGQNDGKDVRPPLPVIREALYDDAILYGASRVGYSSLESGSVVAFRNFDEEMKRPRVWESEQGSASTTDHSRDNLASLYRPPFHLMFQGSFDKAKSAASLQDKWLLVNLQSTKEFSSHMLNRDTWANEAVSQTIGTNFIFWQVYDDTTEGQKVCTYYKLEFIPVVLVIDPITGQKIRSWAGMVQPERLLEDLLPFMDGGPRDHHTSLSHKRPRESAMAPQKLKEKASKEDGEAQQACAASMQTLGGFSQVGEGVVSPGKNDVNTDDNDKEAPSIPEKPTYPPLPEEPKGGRNLLCRVGVRLPDGRRVQRNFLRSEPIQLLWSFCYFQLGEARTKPFRLTHAIPGASKSLDYDTQLTFDQSGLANSMISVTWD